MANNVQVNLQFTADTAKAKQQIQDLQQSLDKIAQGNVGSGSNIMTKQIQEASMAAMQLKSTLASCTMKDGTLDLAKFSTSLKQSGMSLESYRKTLSACGTEGQKAFLDLSKSIQQSSVPLKQTSTLMQNLGTTLKNTVKWQLSSSLIHGFMSALHTSYSYAQDLNESLTNIRIVTGQSSEQMAQFAENANKAAQSLGTTTTRYTDAALIYYQQGLDDKAVKDRTDVTMKLANVMGSSAQEVSNYMTAIWNNFDDGSKSMEYFADVITKLGANTASSSEEIATGLQKFSAVADTVGLSYEYATAALATVVAETRQSADTVGTSFKTLFARIQDLELGDEGTVDIGQYAQALDKVGISVLDANGELKNMDALLDEMGSKWNSLNKQQQVALAQNVAGTRQYTQMVALMENWDKVQANVELARGSEGTLQEQQEIYAESWEAASKRVRAALEHIYSTLLDSDVFIGLLNGLEKVIGYVDTFIQKMGGLKGVLITLGGLMLNLFGESMTKGVQTMAYNIGSLTGKNQRLAEEQKAEANKQVGILSKQAYQTAGGSNEAQATAQSYERTWKQQEEFTKNASRMSDAQKFVAQQAMSASEKLNEEAIAAGKAADAAEREAKAAETSAKIRAQRVYGTTGDRSEKAQAEATSIGEATKAGARLSKLVTNQSQAQEEVERSRKMSDNPSEVTGLDSSNITSLKNALDEYIQQLKNVKDEASSIREYSKETQADIEAQTKAEQEYTAALEKAKDIESQIEIKTNEANTKRGEAKAAREESGRQAEAEEKANNKNDRKAAFSASQSKKSHAKKAEGLDKQADDIDEEVKKLNQDLEEANQKAQELQAKMEELKTKNGQNSEILEFEKKNDDMQTTIDGLNTLKQTLQEAEEANKSFDDVLRENPQLFNDIKGAVEGGSLNIDAYIASLEKGSPRAQEFAEALKKLVADSRNAGEALEDFTTKEEQAGVAAETAGDAVAKTSQKIVGTEEVLRGIGSSLMSISMLITSFKTFVDTFERFREGDASGGELFSAFAMFAGMTLPMALSNAGKMAKMIKEMGTASATAAAATEGQTAAQWSLNAAMSANPVGALIIAFAALAAIIGVVAVASNHFANAEENALKKSQEQAEKAKEKAEELQQKYDDLKTSVENIEEARSALDEMTKGTDQWREAVENLNQQVLELLQTYPELGAAIKVNNDGILELDTQSQVYKDYINQLKADAANGLAEANRKNIQVNEDKNTVDIKSTAKEIGVSKEVVKELANYGSENGIGKLTSELQKFINNENSELSESLKNLTDGELESISTNLVEIANLVSSIEGRETTNDLLRDQIVSSQFDAIGGKWTELEDETVKATVIQAAQANKIDLDSLTDDQKIQALSQYVVDHQDSALAENIKVNGGVASEVNEVANYLKDYGVDYAMEEFGVTINELKSYFDDLGVSAITTADELDALIGRIQNAVGEYGNKEGRALVNLSRGGDFSELNNNQIRGMYDKLFTNEHIGNDEYAQNLGFESWSDLRAKWDEAVTGFNDLAGNVADNLTGSVKEAYEKLDRNYLNIDQKEKAATYLQNAGSTNGRQGINDLEKTFASFGSGLGLFLDAMGNIDFDNIDVDGFKDRLKELGLETNASDAELQQFINLMAQLGSTTLKSATEIYTELNKIKVSKNGDTVTSDEYQTLISDLGKDIVNDLFVPLADGTAMFVGKIEDLQKAIAQTNINNFTKELQDIREIGKYNYKDISGVAIDANFDGEKKTREVNVQKANTQLDALETLANTDKFDKSKVEDWREAITKGGKEATQAVREINKAIEENANYFTAATNEAMEYNAQMTLATSVQNGSQLGSLISSGTINNLDVAVKGFEVLSQKITDIEGLDQLDDAIEEIKELGEKTDKTSEEFEELRNKMEEAYKVAYDNAAESVASGLSYSVEEVKNYAASLVEAAQKEADFAALDESVQQTLGLKMAESALRAQEGFDSLTKTLEQYKDELAEINNLSIEDSQALTAVSEAVSKIVGHKVSTKFIEQNLEDIKKAANGDIEALQKLQKECAKDYVLNLKIPKDAQKNLNKLIDKLDLSDVKLGENIDSSPLVKELTNMVKTGKMTVKEATDILNSLGFDVDWSGLVNSLREVDMRKALGDKVNEIQDAIENNTVDFQSMANQFADGAYQSAEAFITAWRASNPDSQISDGFLTAMYNYMDACRTAGMVTGEAIHDAITGGIPQLETESIPLNDEAQTKTTSHSVITGEQTVTNSDGTSSTGTVNGYMDVETTAGADMGNTIEWLKPEGEGGGPKTSYNGTGSGSTAKPSGGSGGGGGGGGGGGSSKPAKTVTHQTVGDRYHEVDNSLSKVSRNMDKYSTAADRAFGKERIKNLQLMNKELEKQADLTKQKYEEASAYAKEDLMYMNESAARLGVRVEVNEEGDVTNYTQLVRQYQAMVNEKEMAMRAAVTEEQQSTIEEQYADRETMWEDLLDKIGIYEDTENLRRELLDELQKIQNEIYDNQLAEIEYKVQLKIDVEDTQLKYLEFLLNNLDDDLTDTIEKVGVLENKFNSSLNKLDAYKQGISDIFANHGLDGKDIIEQMQNGKLDVNKLADLDLTESEVETLKSYYEGILDESQNLIDIQKEIMDQMMASFDAYVDKIQEGIDKLDTLTSITEHYKNIIDIVGKDTLGISDDLYKQIGRTTIDIAKRQVETNRALLDAMTASRDEAQRALDDAIAAGKSEETIKQLQDVVDQMNAAVLDQTDTFMQAWEDALQTIKDKFDETIEASCQKFADTMAGLAGSAENLGNQMSLQQRVQDVYVKDFEKVYELNKLSRDLSKSIDETDNVRAKQELLALQEKINQRQQDGQKISEYEINALQAEVELTKARLALEEVQNAKTEVRMQRDNEGNYGYVYTANADDVSAAEDEYESKLKEYMELNQKYIDDLQDQLSQLSSDCADAVREIWESADLSKEEKQQKARETLDAYEQLAEELTSETELAFTKQDEVYGAHVDKYVALTGDKSYCDMQYAGSLGETLLGLQTGYEDTGKFLEDWVTNAEAMYTEHNGALSQMQIDNEEVFEKAKANYDDFTGDVETGLGKVQEKANETSIDVVETSGEMIDYMSSLTTAVGNWYDVYMEKTKDMLNRNKALADSFNNLMAAWSAYEEEEDRRALIDLENQNGEGAEGGGPGGSGAGIDGLTGLIGSLQELYMYGYNFLAQRGVSKESILSLLSDRMFIESAKALIQQTYGGGVYEDYIRKIIAKIESYFGTSIGFDTGGYTGDWAGDGKFAMLHQKEIVLNATDTQNILDAVSVIRDLAQMIDMSALSRLDLSAALGTNIMGGNGNLEQNVTINAEFPGVSDRYEIEAAFNNMYNQATQFANRKIL